MASIAPVKYTLPDSDFRFLAYTEDLKIGPSLSDYTTLLEATINRKILDLMSQDEVIEEFIRFTKLIYYRYPRYRRKFKILIKQVVIASTTPRLVLIAKYK